jgi:hypothetical protein
MKKKSIYLIIFSLCTVHLFCQVQLNGKQNQCLQGTINEVKGIEPIVSKSPIYGKFQINSKGEYRFDPKLNYKGTDIAEIKLGETTLTIYINILPSNRKPDFINPYYNSGYYVAISNYFKVKKNTVHQSSVFGFFDPDGDPIKYTLISTTAKGSLLFADNGSFTYTPNEGAEGWDYFSFKLSDGKGGVNTKKATIFIYPGKEEILSKLDASPNAASHPRLVFNKEKIQLAMQNTPAWVKTTADKLVDMCKSNSLYNAAIRDYSKGATRSTASNEWLRTLSFAAGLAKTQTDKTVLFAKTLAEAKAVCNAPNWGVVNSLDVPEMSYQVGLAYTMLYDSLNEVDKTFLKQSLVQKGLNSILKDYNDSGENWPDYSNNWNFTCNSSALLAAMAIWNEPTDEKYNYREIAGQIFENYFKSIPIAFMRLNEGGAWYESNGYFSWMMRQEGFANITLLNTIGTDYGLHDCPGYKNMGYYSLHQSGPKGGFNVADEGDPSTGGTSVSEIVLQPAQSNNLTDLGYYFYKTNYRFGEMTLARYNEQFQINSTKISDPDLQDYYSEGAEFFFSRDKYLNSSGTSINSTACFLAFKAGQNNDWHSALDVGNFVFDAFGERWIRDIGGDDYLLSAYGAKQTCYRKRAEGQNTLVINPTTAIDQSFAWEKIIRKEMSKQKSFAIAEMSSCYKMNAYSVQRGVMLDKVSKNLLIQDEIHTRGAADVYNFMHTKASIIIDASGRKATFTQGSKKMIAYLLSPADVKFTVMNAEALPQSKSIMTTGQNPNTGYRKLVVNIKDSSDIRLAVWLVPFNAITDAEPTTMPTLIPLSEWTLDTSKTPVQLQANTSNSTVSLAWSQVHVATGYNLYKSTTGIDGTYYLMNFEPLTSTVFEDLPTSEKQYYKVSAIVEGDEFATSIPIEAKVISGVAVITAVTKYNIYPNPAKGFVNLSFNEAGKYLVRVYDAALNLKYQQKISTMNQEINTSTFPKGIYFIELSNESGLKEMKKLVVL